MTTTAMPITPGWTCAHGPRDDAASWRDISTQFKSLIKFKATEYLYSIRYSICIWNFNFENIRYFSEIPYSSHPYELCRTCSPSSCEYCCKSGRSYSHHHVSIAATYFPVVSVINWGSPDFEIVSQSLVSNLLCFPVMSRLYPSQM